MPEDLRHKILYERTHVAKYPEWHNGIITGTPCVRSRICRYRAPKTPEQLPSQLPLNLYPCGDLGYLAVPELL